MALEIHSHDSDDDVRLLRLEGGLDARGAAALEATLVDGMRQGWQGILLDFSELEMIDGAGLRVLITFSERLEATGGRLALCAPGADVKKILEIARISRHLAVHDTRRDALQWLRTSVRMGRIGRLAASLLRRTTPGAPEDRHRPVDPERLELAARLLGMVSPDTTG